MNTATVTKPPPVKLWGLYTKRPTPTTLCEEFEAIVADAKAEAQAVIAACNRARRV
jgi:hypothetical protein